MSNRPHSAIAAAQSVGLEFSIKSVKLFTSKHDDSRAFTANVYLAGKPFCTVMDDGWGGQLSITAAAKVTGSEIDSVIAKIGNTKVEWKDVSDEENPSACLLPNNLEMIVGELLDEHYRESQYQKTVKKLGWIEGGQVKYYTKMKPTPENIMWMKSQPNWHSGCAVIQDSTRSELLSALGL